MLSVYQTQLEIKICIHYKTVEEELFNSRFNYHDVYLRTVLTKNALGSLVLTTQNSSVQCLSNN